MGCDSQFDEIVSRGDDLGPVTDDQDRVALVGEVTQTSQQVGIGFGIESRARFVEDQQRAVLGDLSLDRPGRNDTFDPPESPLPVTTPIAKLKRKILPKNWVRCRYSTFAVRYHAVWNTAVVVAIPVVIGMNRKCWIVVSPSCHCDSTRGLRMSLTGALRSIGQGL